MGRKKGKTLGWRVWGCAGAAWVLLSAGQGAATEEEGAWVDVSSHGLVRKEVVTFTRSSWHSFATDKDPRPSANDFFYVAQQRADTDSTPLIVYKDTVPRMNVERTTEWHYSSPSRWSAVNQSAFVFLTIDLTGFPTNEYRCAKVEWDIPFSSKDFKYFRLPRHRYQRIFTQHYEHGGLVLGVTNTVGPIEFDPERWTSLGDWPQPKWEGLDGYCYQIADTDMKLYVQPGVQAPLDPNADREDAEEGDPINTISGSVTVDETDIVIPCPGLPLRFSRAYGSQSGGGGRLGPRWTHSYATRLTETRKTAQGTTYTWRLLHTPRGGRLAFRTGAGGRFTSPKGSQLTLAHTNGFYRLTTHDGVVLRFDVNGVWRSMADPWSNCVSLAYDGEYPDHKLTRVAHSNGQYLDLAYTNGMLAEVSTPEGELSVSFAYTDGELCSAAQVLPGGDLVTTYAYDTNSIHVLTQRVSAAGMTYKWDYETTWDGKPDTVGRASVVGDGYFDTSVTLASYCPWGSPPSPSSPKEARFQGRRFGWPWSKPDVIIGPLVGGQGAQGGDEFHVGCPCMTNDYASWAPVAHVTNRRGDAAVEYAYDVDWSEGQVLGIRGPNPGTNWLESGKGILFEHDDRGNTIETRKVDHTTGTCLHVNKGYDTRGNVTNAGVGFCGDPLHHTRYEWDTDGDMDTLVSVTDPEGARAEYDYTNGVVCRARLCDGTNRTYETTLGYYGNGLLAATTNANGSGTRYFYDAYGHMTSAVPDEGVALHIEYDRLGHVTRIVSPGAVPRATVFESNPLGRVQRIVHADGSEESFQYDGIGNVTSHVDRAGRTTTFSHGPARELATVSRVLSGDTNRDVTVRHHFDEQLNTLGVSDALGRAVEFYRLDLENRPELITNVESQEMSVVYCLGNVVSSVTRFDGTVVSNLYTRSGLLGEERYPDDTNTFGYLKNGLMKTARNADGLVTNAYSLANRLVATTGTAPSSTVRYLYYPAGQISNVASVAGTTTYEIDGGDRLHRIRAPAGTFTYDYNSTDGNLGSVSFPNGIRVRYDYDVLDRLAGLTWTRANGDVLRSLAYRYSAADLITNVTFETGDQAQYHYDSLDRLTSETRASSSGTAMSHHAYSYDVVGNRLAMVGGGQRIDYVVPYGNGGNRLEGWTTAVMEEDLPTYFIFFGNSVRGQGARGARGVPGGDGVDGGSSGGYGHDAAGCVTNIVRENSTLELAWDGRYRLKTVACDGSPIESYGYDAMGRCAWRMRGGSKTGFVYDGPHPVAEVDTTGRLLRSYTWGPGIDNLLAMTDHVTTNTYTFITDHLGSVHAAVDASGVIVESYGYDAWGQVLGVYDATGTPLEQSQIGNHYLWQGRWYNWEAKLYNFRARWYDPQTGRWLSKDPIGIAGGLNQYVAFDNCPVVLRDPDGELSRGPMALAAYASFFLLNNADTVWGPDLDTKVLPTMNGAVGMVADAAVMLAWGTAIQAVGAGASKIAAWLKLKGLARAGARAFWVGKDGYAAAQASGTPTMRASQQALKMALGGNRSLIAAESGAFAQGAIGTVKVYVGKGVQAGMQGSLLLETELPILLDLVNQGIVNIQYVFL